ncbi:MAG: hypothetical protein AAFO58_04095, partial [Pseudomonadota bacterium]
SEPEVKKGHRRYRMVNQNAGFNNRRGEKIHVVKDRKRPKYQHGDTKMSPAEQRRTVDLWRSRTQNRAEQICMHPFAQGREALANDLAFNTDIPVAEALEMLADAASIHTDGTPQAYAERLSGRAIGEHYAATQGMGKKDGVS